MFSVDLENADRSPAVVVLLIAVVISLRAVFVAIEKPARDSVVGVSLTFVRSVSNSTFSQHYPNATPTTRNSIVSARLCTSSIVKITEILGLGQILIVRDVVQELRPSHNPFYLSCLSSGSSGGALLMSLGGEVHV